MNYWFRSPQGFVESIGVDLEKLPTEDFMREHLTKRLQVNSTLDKSRLNALVILYGNSPIGFHTLVPFTEGESGIFHAHIWQSDMRKRGVGFYSYPKACALFMERFNLQKIIFKTPVQNVGAIKVKEKLGIRCIGEEVIGFDIIREGTIGKVFELTREEAL
jgi:RimJ/RimL family protein N-acetyltransferase